ncbi:MAG TPA: glucose-6-phosphate dehydrogenase assembly protein OpcA [Candidatus Limnocylindrales bacterium]|jgi:glucose-6-phosphate dehydrogenase assembly protein OpcA|nr:glucose-6-phosphate dehydrogenase assembly protein OpcA [Candidatus Limnocylindrales bacterium]
MEMLSAAPEGAPTERWHARARSIREIEEQLSRIWAEAARQAREQAPRHTHDGRGVSSPQLQGRLDVGEDVRIRTRTSVLTLLVEAARPETVDRAMDAINTLAGRHPSRAIVLAPGDPDGPPTIEAQIFAQCRLADRGAGEACTEQILLRCGGEIVQHLTGVVAPLLIHDLPVVVWWPDDPPIGTHPFRELMEMCDRVLVDSGTFRDDGTRRLSALAAVVGAGQPVVHDVGWMRLTLWRELLAGLFDHPLLLPELVHARSLRIDVSRPADTFRISKAALFAGWLAAMLDWADGEPLRRSGSGDSLVGTFRRGRNKVRVEFRPVSPGTDRALRSPGSLARVELQLGRGSHEIVTLVTRRADHLLATADWNGARVNRRAGRLEPFGEAPFIAEALDVAAPDRVFEAALARAARLCGR